MRTLIGICVEYGLYRIQASGIWRERTLLYVYRIVVWRVLFLTLHIHANRVWYYVIVLRVMVRKLSMFDKAKGIECMMMVISKEGYVE